MSEPLSSQQQSFFALCACSHHVSVRLDWLEHSRKQRSQKSRLRQGTCSIPGANQNTLDEHVCVIIVFVARLSPVLWSTRAWCSTLMVLPCCYFSTLDLGPLSYVVEKRGFPDEAPWWSLAVCGWSFHGILGPHYVFPRFRRKFMSTSASLSLILSYFNTLPSHLAL
jgi:hypothetical protein